MNEKKFQKKYAQVYEIINHLPKDIKISYRVTETMSKEQAIENIKSLDKKKIYELIDSVPDGIIAKQFKHDLMDKKQKVKTNNLVQQINELWDKIVAKVMPPSAAPPSKSRSY